MGKSCPPGTLCLETTTICAISFCVIIALAVYIYYLTKTAQPSTSNALSATNSIVHSTSKASDTPEIHDTHDTPRQTHETRQSGKDNTPSRTEVIVREVPLNTTNVYQTTQYTDTMLYPPLRSTPNTTTIGLLPINVETRGPTPDMQQVGILRNSTNDRVLALYGRPTYRGSSKWLYYTATDKFHSIKLPVVKNKRDCTSEFGCNELYEDDEVTVKGYDGTFKTTLYQLDAPRYIPYIT